MKLPFHIHGTLLPLRLLEAFPRPNPCVEQQCEFPDLQYNNTFCHILGIVDLLFLEHGGVSDLNDSSKNSPGKKFKKSYFLH